MLNIGGYKDEYICLYQSTVGQNADFSNTATTSSKLTPIILDAVPGVNSTSVHLLFFRLLEYGDNPATYANSSNMSFKIKVDDTIEQYSIYGEAQNEV